MKLAPHVTLRHCYQQCHKLSPQSLPAFSLPRTLSLAACCLPIPTASIHHSFPLPLFLPCRVPHAVTPLALNPLFVYHARAKSNNERQHTLLIPTPLHFSTATLSPWPLNHPTLSHARNRCSGLIPASDTTTSIPVLTCSLHPPGSILLFNACHSGVLACHLESR